MSNRTATTVLAALATLAAGALIAATPSAADPGFGFGGGMDPHYPQPLQGFCPGGGWGGWSGVGYCDGVPYPDGTKWHATFSDGQRSIRCVIDNGSPFPAQMPPGEGCGMG